MHRPPHRSESRRNTEHVIGKLPTLEETERGQQRQASERSDVLFAVTLEAGAVAVVPHFDGEKTISYFLFYFVDN